MLLEFNVRLGDPEAQVLIMRLMSDLLPALIAARDGVLKSVDLRWHAEHALCVVMAAKGYPDEPEHGSEIRGLEAAAADPKVKIFHAGTRRDGERLARRRRPRARGHRTRSGSRRRPRPRLHRGRPDRLAAGFCRRDIGLRATS